MAGSSSSGGLCNYDVFLSFRGEDTRKNFVCHLYRALEQKAINTFIDSEDLDKGSRISELLNAIKESRLSIVVLSENYASSSWCLKELVKILECMDTKNQIVVPIFYQVDPSHIRNLNGKFGQAFANKFGGADKQELESWRSALARVADLSGWDSTKYEDDIKLIEGIVEDTLRKWIRIARPSNPANDLVRMDSHIKEVSLRLCRGVTDVGVVGIWGMGGIGKTTIARAVYEEIAGQFEHKCFLDNVKEAFRNNRQVKMQEELLCRLLKEKVESADLNSGRNMIMERLRMKKVLVVLDDVETVTHIRDLLGNPRSFGVGSRIIITTRNKQSLSEDDELYEPKHLSDDEALELFMKYAFRENQPTRDYNHLSRRAIKYAQGLPLALKVLGASLYNRTERQWEVVLDKLKEIPHIEILDVLKTSFEGLDDSEKDTFLDIACFFRGMVKDFVTEFLNGCGFFPDAALSVLVDRALITLSYNRLDMHDLLQEMGRGIVRQESIKYPEGRSRLWSYEDVDRVLTQSTATEAVECIILDLSNSKMDMCIDSGAFVRMRKLRLLMIHYNSGSVGRLYEDLYYEDLYYEYDDDEDCCNDYTYEGHNNDIEYVCPSDGCKQLGRGDFEFLSHELRFLVWHGCPLESLLSNFNPKNLVRLDMRGSRIEQLWKGTMPPENLKVILLSYCEYLVKIPDLTKATNLETLVLDGCSSLIEVHPPILALPNLLTLSLKRCKKLEIFPSRIHMKSLRTLDLSGCSNLDKFPEIAEVMEKLTKLHLCGSAIKELPSSINNLTGLPILDLKGCKELGSLPRSIHMKSLWTLNLSGHSNLDKYPEIAEVMELKNLILSETSIKELSSSINNLTGLVTLDLIGCRELKILPSPINMESLETLDLSGCSNLEEFPEISEVMETLEYLGLDGTAIKELSQSINNLTGLVTLDLKGCRELKILPSPIGMESLEKLNLSGCSNLEEFPEISKVMETLKYLYLDGTAIKELSSSINNLIGLVTLNLKGCRELKILPSPIDMESLKELILSGCSNLEEFPEISEAMENLEYLYLDGTAIKELPSSIERLQGLKSLSMRNCTSLVCLPDSICNLEHLTCLDLSGCSKLSSLPENIGSLSSLFQNVHQHTLDRLWYLNLSDCNMLELSESIAHLSSLKFLMLCRNNFESLPVTMNRLGRLKSLRLEACDRLKSIPELSSSVEDIDAHDCISLETVSKPKSQSHTKHFFTFSNCFQLVQTNLFRDIVERHSHFQDNCLRPLRLKMFLPGNEVPDWFDHRSMGFSVSVQLPPNWFDSKFLGFAICAVRTRRGTNYHTSPLSAACLCTLKGNFGECSVRFDLHDSFFKFNRWLRSDHMFLGFVPWSECPLIEEGRLVNETYYTEATFKIVVESDFKTELLRITSCGVRLVYANQDEMLNLSMAQPQFHMDSCETGVSFMDTCEMRNKETERAEITEVSRELESSEAGEGSDICHILQLFPELSELGSHSGLPVPEPQVREKKRDNCHRLQLCPELSELGSHSGLPVPEPQVREKERDTGHRLQLFPELSESGSHSGLLVPEPQAKEKERGTCHRLQLFPELLELGSHSGLPVPEPQVREKKRKSPWGFQ